MISLHWLRRDGTHRSATVARERLLKDRTLRRNRFQAQAVQPAPYTIPSPAWRGDSQAPSQSETRLSPRAQKWHVISTARRFPGHHLAELSYNDLRDVTTAIIRPYLAQAQAGEAPFEIRVDGRGHTVIVRLEEEAETRAHFRLLRFFVVLLIAAALTSGALALFL